MRAPLTRILCRSGRSLRVNNVDQPDYGRNGETHDDLEHDLQNQHRNPALGGATVRPECCLRQLAKCMRESVRCRPHDLYEGGGRAAVGKAAKARLP
jgi:hypothetical protein